MPPDPQRTYREKKLTGNVKFDVVQRRCGLFWLKTQIDVVLMIEEEICEQTVGLPNLPTPEGWYCHMQYRKMQPRDLHDPILRWVTDGAP